MHRDVVTEAPPGSMTVGSNDKTEHHIILIPHRVLSVQGHPEFNGSTIKVLLDSRFERGLFGQEIYDEALPCVSKEHDAIQTGQGIIRFILDM